MGKKLSQEDFKNRIKEKLPYIELLGDYSNSRTRIKCKCMIDGFVWTPVAYSLLNGSGCPECKKRKISNDLSMSNANFLNRVHSLNPNIEILSEYKNSKSKIKCKCKIDDNTWTTNGYSLLNGYGTCPECNKRNRMIDPGIFIEKIKILSNGTVDVINYKNTSTKSTLLCHVCNNKWSIIPNNLNEHNFKCPFCNKKSKNKRTPYIKHKGITSKKTHEEFVEKINEKNPNIVFLNKYENSRTQMKCRCLQCGYTWSSEAGSLSKKTNKASCPNCNGRVKTNSQFVDKLLTINDKIKPLEEYNGANKKILCQCLTCNNTWKVKPNDLLSGYGCPICNESHGERNIRMYLKMHNIDFESQMKFDDLHGIGGRRLSYDFYLPTYNILIEYQGQQHERPVNIFGGEEQFEIQKEHDKRKREYAEQNNINLVEIWYYDENNISNILDNKLLIK